jgi:hypothetical protein
MEDAAYFLTTEPSFSLEDWLPGEESPWPELADLHDEHVRLLRARQEQSDAIVALRVKYREEDKGYERGLAEQIGDGVAVAEADMPEVTSAEVREAAIKEATIRYNAAERALADFIKGALKVMAEREAEWQLSLLDHVASAEEKRREARRLLAEADQEVAQVARLQHWVRRAGGKVGLQVAWGHLPPPIPTPLPEGSEVITAEALTKKEALIGQ